MTVRAEQKPDDAAPAVEVPPHPALREYYDANESRQGFLNELFNRTAYQYRAIDKVVGFGSGLWHRRRALRRRGPRARHAGAGRRVRPRT